MSSWRERAATNSSSCSSAPTIPPRSRRWPNASRVPSPPYSIEGHSIIIGTSVGYVMSIEQGNELDHLVACADEALCRVKREGGGVAVYGPPVPAQRVTA